MQAQTGHSESETDETSDTIVFRPKAKMVKFRKIMVPVICATTVLEFLIIILGVIAHSAFLIGIGTFMFLYVGLAAWWYIKQTARPRMKPIMTLSPEGFTVETDPFLGTIPWDQIASVQSGNFLGIPIVRIVPTNKTALRSRLGKGARFMWMYWTPGGLGFSCIPFSMSPIDLAARINRYRERGL